jgi:hypothetical protein
MSDYRYGLAFLPLGYRAAYEPTDLLCKTYDNAVREILATIAPDILAKIASINDPHEEVKVNIRIEVSRYVRDVI